MSFSPSNDGAWPERTGTRMAEPIRIRKYPNRRLYDTSRSQHLTHDGVLALIAEGRTVQVTDSRSGIDITNAVLLQIMIERDPTKVGALPSELIHRAMRSDVATMRQIAEAALASWRQASPDAGSVGIPQGAASGRTSTMSVGSPSAMVAGPNGSQASRSLATASMATVDGNGRPKAKAKRTDGNGDLA